MITEEHVHDIANQIKEGFKTVGFQDDFIYLLVNHPDKVSAYLSTNFIELLSVTVMRTGKEVRGQLNEAVINQILDELKKIYAREIEALSS